MTERENIPINVVSGLRFLSGVTVAGALACSVVGVAANVVERHQTTAIAREEPYLSAARITASAEMNHLGLIQERTWEKNPEQFVKSIADIENNPELQRSRQIIAKKADLDSAHNLVANDWMEFALRCELVTGIALLSFGINHIVLARLRSKQVNHLAGSNG